MSAFRLLFLTLLLLLTATGCFSSIHPPIPTLVPTAKLLPAETAVSALLPPATATLSPSPAPTQPATATATAIPAATATLPPTSTAVPSSTPPRNPANPAALTLTPGEPQGYLSQFRLVSFYGSPVGPGLGILGEQPREETLALLRETMTPYESFSHERPLLPAYHLVVTVADPHPPNFRHHVDTAVISDWVNAAKEDSVAVILDIQPGRVNPVTEYQRIRDFLYEPHVHVAIDPEFAMNDRQIPGQQIGQLYAADINAIQADLNEIGRQIGLNRVLILHQFADKMLPDKEAIVDYPFVELVIDGDGVGSPTAKLRNYNQYATEPAFEFGGFKLFPTDGDWPVLTPAEVMTALDPPPVLIIYQ